MNELKIEHYKALKNEQQQYMMQIHQLWIFKLSTLGAVIAIAIFNDKIVDIGSFKKETIVACGLILLPLLAMLIDLKVLEFSLHIKAITNHFIQQYQDIDELFQWESQLWSKGLHANTRTWLTIAGAIGTSVCILVVSFVFVCFLKPDWKFGLIISGILLISVPAIAGMKLIPKLLN